MSVLCGSALSVENACAVAIVKLVYPTTFECRLTPADDRSSVALPPCGPDQFVIGHGSVCDPANRVFGGRVLEKFDNQDDAPMGGAGLLWQTLGPQLLSGMGAIDVPAVHRKAYYNFFKALDRAARHGQATDLWYQVRQLLLLDADGAKPAAVTLTAFMAAVDVIAVLARAHLEGLVRRENLYVDELDVLVESHQLAIAKGDGVMVLPHQPSTHHRYLRAADPRQFIRFLIFPTDACTWRIWTVDYQHRPFDTYAPILPVEELPAWLRADVKFVHRKRFVANASTQAAAVAVARASLDAYYHWSGGPSRLLRWLLC